MIGKLNINSLLKKFDDLKVKGMLNILINTETNLDNTFPVSQLRIDGHS